MKIMKPLHFVTTFVSAWLLLGAGGASAPAAESASADGEFIAFVGTYTGPKSKGIYAFRLDAKGGLMPLGVAAQSVSPTFLAVHPNQRFLYAANEVGNFRGQKSGAVTAFAINAKTGKLALLNQQSSGGGGPCHLAVDNTGKWLLVANYGGGSIAVLPIKGDGSLGEAATFIQHAGSSVDKRRQEGPHAHFITPDPANRFALTCDLGLDKVLVYKFDPAKGSLAPNDPPAAAVKPGSGPRHLAFHPNGRLAYVINEMASTLTAFTYDGERGELKEVQTVSTLPADFKGSSTTAEVEVHPSGKFVYGSNRGHDSIVVFSIDESTGKLTYVEHQSTQGKMPRHFAIAPGGAWLLAENQGSDSIVVFRIDAETGRLTRTGPMVEGLGAPVCVKFVPVK